MSKDHTLDCPHCQTFHELDVLFSHCSIGWLKQHWLLFHCPDCEEYSHLHIAPSHIEIGLLEGAPAPNFMTHASIPVTGVTLSEDRGDLHIRHARRMWKAEAR